MIRHRTPTVVVLAAIVLAGLLGPTNAARAQAPADAVMSAVQTIERSAGAAVKVTRSSRNGLLSFVSASAAPIPVSEAATAPPEKRARAFMAAHGRAFGIADAADLDQRKIQGLDEVGTEHVRFQQLHRGIPVTGAELIVHLRGAAVVAVNARVVAIDATLDTKPTIAPADALAAAEAIIAKDFGITDAAFSPPRLEVFDRAIVDGHPDPTRLAWFVTATTAAPRR